MTHVAVLCGTFSTFQHFLRRVEARLGAATVGRQGPYRPPRSGSTCSNHAGGSKLRSINYRDARR